MAPKKNSLQNQTKFFLLLTFLVMGLIGTILLKTIMLGGLYELEDKYVKEHVFRVGKNIQEKLDQLQQTAQDYAAWDDSYEYVVNHNPDFENSNLTEATFENLGLNVMVYVDQAGEYACAKGMSNHKDFIPIYKSMRDNLQKSGLLTNTDIGLTVQGIIMLEEGPMLIASHPIIHSDYSGPVRGNLIVGRLLDQNASDEISKNLNLHVTLESIDKNNNPMFNKLTAAEPITLDSTDDNTILAYSMLPDIFKQPAVGVIVTMNRDFSVIGRTALKYLAGALAIIALLSILLIEFFFNIMVLERLKKLSENVSNIGNEQSNSHSMADDLKNDEISVVNNAILCRTQLLVETNEALANEVTLRKSAQEKIEQLAYYDPLTCLPNRTMLVNRLQQAIDLAKRIEKPIGILFLDLDGFKTVNDTLGHFQGDELLKAVAARLITIVRHSDTVARMGGDEFIIMAQNLESADQIQTVADKIINAFRKPFELDHNEIYVTASVGISIFPTDGETHETLIKNADLAMYKAKEKGKNQSVVCTAIMKDVISEKMKLSNGLYRTLERNELEVYYQPQIDLKTKKIVGLEALLRWNHPELGLVYPGKFIHLAEQTGLINPIGKWVLHTVCAQNKAWQEAGIPSIRIAVNLSIIQFQNSDIVGEIKEILEETKLAPEYLELEITESIAMRDKDYIIQVLNTLQDMGIYISIDDFGTEFSSLKYLKVLPINRIKIPMPFIQGIDIDVKDEAITKTIIVLARNMGLEVIAEGVETESQELFLSQQMCDSTQGFYYYKPMPADKIKAILQMNR